MSAPVDLKLLESDSSDWEQLFLREQTGEFVEKSYPNGEMHGGGPVRYQTVTEAYAREKYSF
ncbi:hypothetical protein MMA231_00709 [Asticcacaulis sp. MM231]|uniref:hypothetical protein n=1 Tax=Asticcacaulis sp. MM231 TaxID=3157666 RepID=UPI0032D5873A